MSEEDDIPISAPRSMPAWVMTFADLMSLLMCFFVLLLSFSEMDLQKFKQVAGSMEKAFGVQRELKFAEPPKGTSVIAQEFSPAKPDPTPLNEIRQITADEEEEFLRIEQLKRDAQAIAESMLNEIKQELIEVEIIDNQIIIRISENSSFDSGSANLKSNFIPILDKIAQTLTTTAGQITIAGFTDNVPIKNAFFRSNWELSAVRAVAVVEALLRNSDLNHKRFLLSGHGENKPLVENNTVQNRTKNRRVEIIIKQGPEYEYEEEDVIFIESEEDTKSLPNIEIEKVQDKDSTNFSVFPPVLEITRDLEDYFATEKDLGLFEEEALYVYELEKLKNDTNNITNTQNNAANNAKLNNP